MLASALAKLTGETKTEAVTQALRERLERVRRARARKRLADELDELFISRAQLSLVPVDEDHAHLARDAFRKYGKGRHPAGLDYGDCFSYALARSRDEPLLFKGNDFSKTDVECRPASG